MRFVLEIFIINACVLQPVKFLHDTVVAHGMSVGQLKQAILSELAEKQVMSSVPLNWSVVALFSMIYICMYICPANAVTYNHL